MDTLGGQGENVSPNKTKKAKRGASGLSRSELRDAGLTIAAAGGALFLLLVAVLALLWVFGFTGFARSFWTVARLAAPFVYSALVVVGLVGAVAFGSSSVRRVASAIVALSIVGGFASLVGIGSSAGVGNVWSALNRGDHETRVDYLTSAVVTAEQRPGYDERTALAQADFSIRRSLSGVVGDIAEPTRVDDEWCSYVTTAATNRNRWTESVVCLADDGAIRTAVFPADTVPAVRSGFRHSRLSNAMSRHGGLNAVYDADDAYGYIGEVGGREVARLVVPFADYRGYDYSISRMPAGAVVFGEPADGSSEVEVVRSIEPGTHPGPVVGLSTAARVRESVNDLEGFLVSARPTRSSSSLQPTFALGEITDESDPNIGNATEFVLYRDGVPYGVTPLTSYGASSTITAYLEVRLDTLVAGEAPAATIYRLPEGEAATTTLTNSVRVLYGQDLSESDQIYEVTPVAPGRSKMTIGREDQTRFVAQSETRIANGEPVGQICIYSRTGTELDCSQLSDDPKPLGTLVRSGRAASTESTDETFAGDLADIPTRALLDELERRLAEQ